MTFEKKAKIDPKDIELFQILLVLAGGKDHLCHLLLHITEAKNKDPKNKKGPPWVPLKNNLVQLK